MLFWLRTKIWLSASYNTMWCLIGCASGDLGTILFFQLTGIAFPFWGIFTLAIVNGLLLSFALETAILMLQRKMPAKAALKIAASMSMISMISMELAMNIVDYYLTGGLRLSWGVLPPILAAGFIFPMPYNYWRLEALGKACH